MNGNIHPETGREETDWERADRNVVEMMAELRVALPGVQVLFAFLLVVPFNTRFAVLGSGLRVVYIVALLCTAAASALFIAPTAHHRLTFRRGKKENIALIGNRLVIVGLGFLAMGMSAAILLVSSFVFTLPVALVTTLVTMVVFAVLWFFIPRRWR
jgi:hypothetical protein